MEWTNDKPKYASQIRVNRGFYSHHGIYIDDDHVIHFGSLTKELDPATASIIMTTLSEFLNGGILEVASYNEEELKERFSDSQIVNQAYSRLGEKGYNLISNNCEHFSNECCFGKKDSRQVDDVLKMFSALF